MMWFIHLYMQFGCLALDEIIHVSDQPVEPSLGRIAATGGDFLSAWIRVGITCQVVPTTESPAVKADCSFVESGQDSPIEPRCCLSRSTAALNCLSSSS